MGSFLQGGDTVTQKRRPLIVGVDPGTTVGVAVFSLDGELVLTHSRKNFSPAALRQFVLQYGNPVLVCNDTLPAQKAAVKVAASFGARLFVPGELVSRREKRRLLKEFTEESGREFKNEHERDAVFAALLAWASIRPLMEKVDHRLAKAGARELADEVKSGILANGLNIAQQLRHLRARAQ